MEIREIDYRRFELVDEALQFYYVEMSKTLDTADYVPERKCKAIARMLFKEFKYTLKQAKKNYKKAYKYERKQERKAKTEALKAKLKAKLMNIIDKFQNKKASEDSAGQGSE